MKSSNDINSKRRIKYLVSADPRSQKFNNFITTNYPEFVTETHPDLVLVTGGDGSMLHAIQSDSHFQVPFFGHAAGTLNYLMNSLADPDAALKTLLNPSANLHIVETTSIKVDLLNTHNQLTTVGYAVNEVVFGRDVMGYHTYNILSEDGSFDNFEIRGTGISICTDLGSTGYNFNLGGSILPLGSNLWCVVGVVCNRYLNDILHIQKVVVNSSKDKKAEFSVFLDGIKKLHVINPNEAVVLSQGPKIQIAFLNKTDFIRKRVDISSRYRKF